MLKERPRRGYSELEPRRFGWVSHSHKTEEVDSYSDAEPVKEACCRPSKRTASVSAEKRFRELAVIWKRETLYISNVKKKVTHPAYQQILTMGRDVIPYILQDLKIDPADWFWALTTITGENPIQVSDAGDVHRMASAWIKWGTDQGLLDG